MNAEPPLHPELEALLSLGHAVSFSKGEVIIRPAEDGNEIFYLKSGLVKAYVIGNNGEEHIHVLFKSGDLFPIIQAAGGIRLDVYFAAVTDCDLIKLSSERFLRGLKNSAQACFEVLRLMATQYATYVARVDNLEYKFARERLAYRLLLLARKIGIPGEGGIVLPHLSQFEIGSTINLSRESVSRELGRFERLGLISHNARGIVIKDKDALRRELGHNNHTLYIDDRD